MAKKFIFRLESVLKLREHKTQQAKEDLMQVVGLRNKKELEIEERNIYLNNILKKKHKDSTAFDMQAIWRHKVFVDEEIKNLEIEKQNLLEIENIKRIKLTEAMKEEKILDKLKEKKKKLHNEEMEQESQKFLDEVAINHHGKNTLTNI
jgi:flagellar protein FliJ